MDYIDITITKREDTDGTCLHCGKIDISQLQEEHTIIKVVRITAQDVENEFGFGGHYEDENTLETLIDIVLHQVNGPLSDVFSALLTIAFDLEVD